MKRLTKARVLTLFLIILFTNAYYPNVHANDPSLPDLVGIASAVPSTANTQSVIPISWTVQNQGLTIAKATWFDTVWLSTDDNLDSSDIRLQFGTGCTYTAGFGKYTDLAPDESYTVNEQWVLNWVEPMNVFIPEVTPGLYYIIVAIDSTDWVGYWGAVSGISLVDESDQSNNLLINPLTIYAPDLSGSISTSSTTSTQSVTPISWTVTNQGLGTALSKPAPAEIVGTSYDTVWLSTDTKLDLSDIRLRFGTGCTYPAGYSRVDPVMAGGSYTVTTQWLLSWEEPMNIYIPAIEPGQYYLLIALDSSDYLGYFYSYPDHIGISQIYETNENNNLLVQPITIMAPDLSGTLTSPLTALTQSIIPISWSITNQGEGTAYGQDGGLFYTTLWLSSDQTLEYDKDTKIGNDMIDWQTQIAPGQSYGGEENVYIPTIEVGKYYLILDIDSNALPWYPSESSFRRVWETNEENNQIVAAINILSENPSTNFDLKLNAGWNMVSFPILPNDPSFSAIFDDLSYYQVLTWTGTSYTTPTTAVAGQGYWVLVLSEKTVNLVAGTPVNSFTLDLPAGWSMIGGANNAVNCESIFSGYYQTLTWSGTSYTTATTIEPGKGYWGLVLTPTHVIIG